jgi:hypothetical protein
MAALLSQTSHAAYWSPHVGIDYKYWGARAGASPGNDETHLFPTINSALNFYVGTRINGIWGLDLGYEQSEKKEKTATFNGAYSIFGDLESAGDWATAIVRLKAGHLDASFYWEIYQAFELVFMGGIAYLKPDTQINYYSSNSNFFTLEKVKSKWVGRGGFGAQYNPVPCIGLRALLHFDGTQRIEYIGNDEDGAPYDIRPYKSATSFYVGAVYSFLRPRR